MPAKTRPVSLPEVRQRQSGRRSAKTERSQRGEAIETSDSVLREEIRRADRACKDEEDACSDAESLNDPDYVDDAEDDESSSDGSYESDFIDDSDVDQAETKRALKYVRWK